MITNAILFVVQGILNVLLAPLTALNFAVDLTMSIPVVKQFLQIAVYLLPWDNLRPILIIIIVMFTFRAVLSLIRLVWSFIPIIGN